jgi:hypothetical protein
MHQTCFGGMEPVALLAVEDYLEELQKQLGGYFADAELLGANEMQFAQLTLIREKCKLAYQATLTLNDWVIDDTYVEQKGRSKQDTFFIKAYQLWSANTSVPLTKVTRGRCCEHQGDRGRSVQAGAQGT